MRSATARSALASPATDSGPSPTIAETHPSCTRPRRDNPLNPYDLNSNARLDTVQRPVIELLTRDGCSICLRMRDRLAELSDELGFDLITTDVDAAAAAGRPALRAEFGDRLPVVLLDGAEHSYWEIDEPRLRRDLAARTGGL